MATEARGETGEISGSEKTGGDGVGNKLEEEQQVRSGQQRAVLGAALIQCRTFKLPDLW